MSFENNKPHVNFEIKKKWIIGRGGVSSFNPSDSISNSILLGYPGLKKAKHLKQ
jgi:hypothetical protein